MVGSESGERCLSNFFAEILNGLKTVFYDPKLIGKVENKWK